MNNKSQLGSVIGELKGQNSRDLEAQRAAIDKQIVDMIMQQTAMNVEDIVKGLSKRKKTVKEALVTPNTANKVGNVNANFYADAVSASKPKLRKGDSAANLGEKIYAVMKQDIDDRKLRSELSKNKEEEQFEEDKRRHEELIKVINKAKAGTKPVKANKEPQPRDEKGRFIKKEPTPTKTEAPAPKPTEAPKPAPKTTEAPAPKPTEAPASKPATATKPSAEAPAAPSAVKPPATTTTGGVSTAAKVAVIGAGAISGAAALSIERETGKSASQAIKNVGQIVPNDPKPGVTSYGIFGINSQGSIQSFVKDNPQFELSAKPASKEFDMQWSKISKEKSQEMLNAQIAWYEKNITNPLKKDLTKIVPNEFSSDPRVLTYMSDRRVQYGKVLESQALSYASSAKTIEEFLRKISEYDIEHLQDAFKTYLSNHPDAIKGLQKRIREREKSSLKAMDSDITTGNKLNNSSVENKDLKTSSNGNNVAIDNTKTNIISSGGSAPQTIRTPTPSERPAIIGG